MSKWCGIAIFGIWSSFGIISFSPNVNNMADASFFAFLATCVVCVVDFKGVMKG